MKGIRVVSLRGYGKAVVSLRGYGKAVVSLRGYGKAVVSLRGYGLYPGRIRVVYPMKGIRVVSLRGYGKATHECTSATNHTKTGRKGILNRPYTHVY